MSQPSSPGESQRGAPRFFVGCEDDESEDPADRTRTDMELYMDDEDGDTVGGRHPAVAVAFLGASVVACQSPVTFTRTRHRRPVATPDGS